MELPLNGPANITYMTRTIDAGNSPVPLAIAKTAMPLSFTQMVINYQILITFDAQSFHRIYYGINELERSVRTIS